MPSLAVKLSVKKEEKSVKKGTVGKLTTEVRKKVPDTKCIKNNYYVNKAKQVNKIVIKNRSAAPLRIESHANDVCMNYSPAVFKEAVMIVTEAMKEGETFEIEEMSIKVTKVMPSIDLKKIKTQDLITLEVLSKVKNEKPVKLQVHVYYTSQGVMVQAHRKVGGIKGFKLFVEKFFQPHIEMVIKFNQENIKKTKQVITQLGEDKRSDTSDVKEIAKDMINEMVTKATSENKELDSERFNCPKCEGKFVNNQKLQEHIEKIHTDAQIYCETCQTTFRSEQELTLHNTKIHEIPLLFSCQICHVKLTSYHEMGAHIEKNHEKESIIRTEASKVISSISKKFKGLQYDDKVEEEHVSLKRANSTSPTGLKSKSFKTTNTNIDPEEIEVTNPSDKEEDLKLVKQECIDLKTENLKLRKQVKDVTNMNKNLRLQLKNQEEDAVKAMKAIKDQIELETEKVVGLNKEEKVASVLNNKKELAVMEKEYKKKLSDLKEEKDKIMEDMVKM